MVDETPEEHVEAHEHRQEIGDARHQHAEDRADINEIRQDASDTRQDVSDTRQDVGEAVTALNAKNIKQGQGQQDVTNLITNAHTEQITGMQLEQAAVIQTQADQSSHLDRITEGVDFLAVQVTTLNERVYTKNYLDRIRNYMIAGGIITFLFVSILLAYILVSIRMESNKEADRAEVRANEALLARRQIFDCTVPAGVVLEDGFVNVGECFKRSQAQTGAVVAGLVDSITEEVRKLLIMQAEATAANRELSSAVRDSASAQARALRVVPTNTIVASTTTTMTTMQPRPPPPLTPPPTPNPDLLCNVLSIVGLCDA